MRSGPEPDPHSGRVLIVETDTPAAEHLASALLEVGYEVENCTDGDEIAALLKRADFDVVLSDQDIAGIEAFAGVLDESDSPAVILLKSFGAIQDAVEAVRSGAFDYLSKPTAPDQVLMAVERAIEQRTLARENERLREEMRDRFSLGQIKSRDDAMHKIFRSLSTVAETRATVLIQGESGTGKTCLARALHQGSTRADRPFVEVNCGALPDALLESELFGHVRGAFTGAVKDKVGKFEQADGGTIFLDEIACASLDLQVKLLRVLQDKIFERVGDTLTRTVDVRVVAASNRALADEVRAGRFREDLYYRLNVVALEVPPLRERPGDVRLLAEHFLERFGEEYERASQRFSPDALNTLLHYHWPGNVRELENCVERAVLLSQGGEILADDLAAEVRAAATGAEPGDAPALEPAAILPLKRALEGPEKRIIEHALSVNGGNRKDTAAMLEVNRTTLFNKMKKYGLLDIPFRPAAD